MTSVWGADASSCRIEDGGSDGDDEGMRILRRLMPDRAGAGGALNIDAPRWRTALEHLVAALVLMGAEAGVVVLVRAVL